jgi:hypothetical protein
MISVPGKILQNVSALAQYRNDEKPRIDRTQLVGSGEDLLDMELLLDLVELLRRMMVSDSYQDHGSGSYLVVKRHLHDGRVDGQQGTRTSADS